MSRLLSIAGLMLVAVLCAAASDKVKEPATGHQFDAEIKGATADVSLTCTGVGCRKATMLGVKVYAIAQWIDAKGAQKALDKWKGKSGKDLASNQDFYDALAAADVEKRFQLAFVRDVTAKEIREGFGDGLTLAYGDKLSSSAQSFLALFSTDVDEGQTIEIQSLPGHIIEVHQNGKSLGRMPADAELAKAVWGIYFGKKLADSHLEQVKPELIARMDAIW